MKMLRLVLVGAAALAVAAGVAPVAQAATTTSCANGITTTAAPSVVTFGTGCPGFTDNGAPYVFDVAKLTELVMVQRYPNEPSLYYFYNVVVTCTAVVTSPYLQANGCGWTP